MQQSQNQDKTSQNMLQAIVFPGRYALIAAGSILFYILSFAVLYRLTGFGSSIIAVIPVIVIAWLYGFLPGICAGLIAAPINILMYTLLGEAWFDKGILSGTIVLGTAAVTFIGAIVGRLRDLGLKLRAVNNDLHEEVKERTRAEEELVLHRDHLDELVKKRTGELQMANQQLVDSEHELRESKEFIENVFETTGDGIFVTDSEGHIVRANRTFYDMTGYSQQELIGKHVLELSVRPAREGQGHPVIEQLFAEGIIKGFETQQVKKDGTVYPVELNITTLRDADNNLIGSVCSVRDITARKQMEEQAKSQQEQLQQAAKMASLGTLVAGVAHEINNPINMILMQNSLNRKVWKDIKPDLMCLAANTSEKTYGGLSLAYINENFEQLLADVGSAAGRVENIVKELKNFSRKTDEENKTPIDINQVLKNAVNLTKTTVRKVGITLDLQPAEDIPLIEGNPQNIEQVFINIIINAVEAIDHDSGHIKIISCYDPERQQGSVVINDNGKGIPHEIQDKIFDPFLTTKQAEGGTGLGLSICYNIVEQHKGMITVVSTPNQGATFTVCFPVHTGPNVSAR